MRVSMTIPNKPNENRYNYVIESVERAFSGMFGGFTEYPAMGGWVMRETGELIKEPVVVIEGMDCGDYEVREVGELLYDLSCEAMSVLTEEEAVMYTIDGKCYLTFRE